VRRDLVRCVLHVDLADADSERDAHTHADTHSYADSHANADTDRHADASSARDTDTNADTHLAMGRATIARPVAASGALVA
jgi:hypothetical protein